MRTSSLHECKSEEERRAKSGKLTIFFGTAPGVGKTYAMLESARDEHDQQRDVVIGVVETHGRSETAALMRGREVVPRRTMDYRGVKLEELDLDAVLARSPGPVLVDELGYPSLIGEDVTGIISYVDVLRAVAGELEPARRSPTRLACSAELTVIDTLSVARFGPDGAMTTKDALGARAAYRVVVARYLRPPNLARNAKLPGPRRTHALRKGHEERREVPQREGHGTRGRTAHARREDRLRTCLRRERNRRRHDHRP
jgi:Osmosensitive K+ channel His kinase sensor domain